MEAACTSKSPEELTNQPTVDMEAASTPKSPVELTKQAAYGLVGLSYLSAPFKLHSKRSLKPRRLSFPAADMKTECGKKELGQFGKKGSVSARSLLVAVFTAGQDPDPETTFLANSSELLECDCGCNMKMQFLKAEELMKPVEFVEGGVLFRPSEEMDDKENVLPEELIEDMEHGGPQEDVQPDGDYDNPHIKSSPTVNICCISHVLSLNPESRFLYQ
ncbi:uncharacterized protein LOC133386883 [Rhineura floridana]|uniref:uncharacterized protein LOC133386883 n=1 Tax=Rhineura floridana TaxID=261503 RepID=UPI002AC891A1|nr:uncharacterized protein LOC133386883 [Rhineura floridana]